MALIFPGKSKCAICGNVIQDAANAVSFPAFLPRNHQWHMFSDAAFHRSCFENCPDRHELEGLYNRYCEIWQARPANLTSLEDIEAWGKTAFKEFNRDGD